MTKYFSCSGSGMRKLSENYLYCDVYASHRELVNSIQNIYGRNIFDENC